LFLGNFGSALDKVREFTIPETKHAREVEQKEELLALAHIQRVKKE